MGLKILRMFAGFPVLTQSLFLSLMFAGTIQLFRMAD